MRSIPRSKSGATSVCHRSPGVWGVSAAAEYHYGTGIGNLNRRRAARLAACLPAPRSRRPQQMDNYSGIILERMRSRGW